MSSRHQKGYMPYDRTGNRILVKSELGHNKPSNYNIPDTQFIYGKVTPDDPEHANEVMYDWNYHNHSYNPNDTKVKDLIQTNKNCLKKLLHTSNQYSDFRKTQTKYKTFKEGTNVVPIRLPQPNHAYGKPLDLQDPVKLVIMNSYGEDDKLARHTFYANSTHQASEGQRRLSCHITKNHNLLKEATSRRLEKFNWDKKEELWKISKFTQVGFKVNTRRPQSMSVKS